MSSRLLTILLIPVLAPLVRLFFFGSAEKIAEQVKRQPESKLKRFLLTRIGRDG